MDSEGREWEWDIKGQGGGKREDELDREWRIVYLTKLENESFKLRLNKIRIETPNLQVYGSSSQNSSHMESP